MQHNLKVNILLFCHYYFNLLAKVADQNIVYYIKVQQLKKITFKHTLLLFLCWCTVTFTAQYHASVTLWALNMTRAVPKNWYANIQQYLFSCYQYCIVTRVSWYVSYPEVLAKTSPKVTQKTQKNTYALHFYVINCSVQLKCKSALKFHFSFWCYGSYIRVFSDFPIPFK